MHEYTGLSDAGKYQFQQADRAALANRPPVPPAQPVEPVPPPNLKQAIATGLHSADQTAQAMNNAAAQAASLSSMAADPGAAIASAAGAAADEKMNQLVSGLASKIGQFPAATLLSMALGIPHAHIKHPPSGPPPLPPIPLPPLGPIMLGTSVTVLINGKPTARCGDYGFNPTCCGVVPPLSALFQIVTGSSNVYIGGSRAARSGIDITMHCFNLPSPKISLKVGKLAAIASKVGKVASKVSAVAGKVAGVAGKVAGVASKIATASEIASSFADAEASDDSAMASAIGLSVAMMAAQAAADAAAAAMTGMIGTDQPCIPPVGTPGMIVDGSPNVMLGGFPLPSFSAIAQGLLKRLSGLKFGSGESHGTEPRCNGGKPINFITGACFDSYVDYELSDGMPFRWERFYDSRWSTQSGPFGPGFRHYYQRELRQTLDGFEYIDQKGNVIAFEPFEHGKTSVLSRGFRLRSGVASGLLVLEEMGKCQMEFLIRDLDTPAPVQTLREGTAWIRFDYNRNGNLQHIRNSQSRNISVRSDMFGRISQLWLTESGVSAARLLAEYTYDLAGDLIQFQDALGNIRTYTYDSDHRMTCNVDRRGYATFNEYDVMGRCNREYCADGLYDVRVQYFPETRCATATYADGATATYFYDENKNPTEIIERSGGKIQFQRGEDGRLLKQIDPLGNVTSILYNKWGGEIGQVSPLGYHLPPTHVDPNPPNPLAYHLPLTSFAWEHGDIRDHHSVRRSLYDDPVLSRYPSNIVGLVPSLTSLDVTRDTGSRSRRRKIRDALGRVVEEVDNLGAIQRWTYDPEGNVLEYQDRDGSTRRFKYKSWNLTGEDIAPHGGSTRFDYSIRAEPTRVIDANGTISEFLYDHWDRLVEVRRHGRVKERYKYDTADNLIEKADSEGRILVSFEVVPGNLHGARHLASGESHHFKYDTRGRFVVAATDHCETTFAYDALGRLIKDLCNGHGVEHTFQLSRLGTTAYFKKFLVNYAHSEEEVKITDPTGGLHRIRFSRKRFVSRELSNGCAELSCYDEAGRCLQKVGTKRFKDEVRWNSVFAYSSEGDLLEAVGHDGVLWLYEYDESHRLRRENVSTGIFRIYEHDVGGNLIRQPGLTNVTLQEGNRLGSANGDDFAYNDRNHISSRHGPNRSIRYEYNALDMLTAIDIAGERWTAEYDALGRRVSKTWKGETTRYYWDDFRLSAEEQSNGEIRLYIYEDHRALVPFLFVDYESRDAEPQSGRGYFVFTNHIGVPIRVDNSLGQMVWQARIDPFGLCSVSDDSSVEMPLRFPGHYFDRETGLHYNRFRYYDPGLGRYLQSDPYGLAGGINLYAYCANPLTRVDLDGLHPDQPGPSEPGNPNAGPNKESAKPSTPPSPVHPPRPKDVKKGGPHAPGTPLQSVIDRAYDPKHGGAQGRWNSEEAARDAAARTKGKGSVPIKPGDGVVVRPNVDEHGNRDPTIEPASRAAVIPQEKGGQTVIHTFPIGPEHELYNVKGD